MVTSEAAKERAREKAFERREKAKERAFERKEKAREKASLRKLSIREHKDIEKEENKKSRIKKKLAKEIFDRKATRLKSSPIARGIGKLFKGAMKTNPRTRRTPVRRAPARRAPIKRRAPAKRAPVYRPQPTAKRTALPTIRQPLSIKRLQVTPTQRLMNMLSPSERAEVSGIGIPIMARLRAMDILRKRIKVQKAAYARANPRVVRGVDPFNSNRIVESRKVPVEGWMR